MEEISSRRSSNDDYGGSFGNSLMEPTVHDVMSLELSHHSLGDSYLDPRSFGDGNSFDEFGGVDSRYEVDGGVGGCYEQAPPQQAPPIPQRPPQTHYQNQHHHQQQQPQIQRRYECPPQGAPQQVQRTVPTYPVKTADPSTCTQYAPVRTLPGVVKSAARRSGSSRSTHKKEPMDPKTVEDEVARNVSQILSATKQQKLAQEAQQRSVVNGICGGILPPVRTPNYSCSDCGKGMTSHRNLVRHRQTACYKKVDEWVDRSQCWPEQCNNERDRFSEDSDSLPGMGGNSIQHSSYSSESSGWCSPNNSYSPTNNQMGTLDPANLAPLSLDTDDSQTHSSSASHCSSASNGPQTSFICESCKKSVSSLRSLKRHHTTCKQYIQEYGPPPDSDAPRTRPIRRPKVASSPESEGSGSPSPVISEGRAVPQSAAADSTQKDDDEGVPKQSPAHNTCTDCNRQLCSASNLKRHRATCKMAMTKSESPTEESPLPPPSYSHIDIPERERSIINRSYAAAVAASEQVREAARQSQAQAQQQQHQQQNQQRQQVQQHHSQQQHQPQQQQVQIQQQPQHQQQQHHVQQQQMQERPRQQYTAFIVTSPGQKPQPWVTVGEHLRAKHVQQKMLEASGGTVITQGATLVTQGRNVMLQGGTIVDQGRSVSVQGGSVLAVVKHDDGGIMIAEQRNGYAENGGFINVKIEEKPKVVFDQPQEMRHYEKEPQLQQQQPQQPQQLQLIQPQPQQQQQQICIRTTERSQQPLHHLPQKQQHQNRPQENSDIPPLDSIITTQPLNGDNVTGVPVLVHDSRNYAPRQAQAASAEFQCPECKKTYSCRKNVKRHRMAVHKLSADDITRYPGPTPCATAVMVDSPQLSPSLPRMMVIPKVDAREGFKTETVPLSPSNQGEQQQQSQQMHQVHQNEEVLHSQNQHQMEQIVQPPQQYRFNQVVQQPRPIQPRPPREQVQQQEEPKPKSETEVDSWRQSREYYDEEETAETARIAAELKRSAEQELAEIAELEEKKIRPELAEADTTTFNEDSEFGNRSHHSSPGAVSSATSASNALPPLSTWMSSKPLSVEIPYGSHSRSADSSPLLDHKRARYDSCDDPAPMLGDPCPEDSLSCGDPMLGHGPSSAPRTLDDDCWFKREEVPDSTTCQSFRADRSTSPCLMDHADTPALGSLPYSRKRVMAELPSNDPKQARHLCGDCGKFYSSEWNLERHRRESCPTKTNQGSPNGAQNDDISVLMGSMRFVLSKSALTRASASFAQLFNVHDPAKGELRLDTDPQHFQMLLDTYNNPAYLCADNIDRVVDMAVKYKFQAVIDSCAKFIGEELPKTSVMHAIRLAEQHKMTSIKQRLFDSISIDVFRALAADHDYKLMTAELKAELLEKWGTFL